VGFSVGLIASSAFRRGSSQPNDLHPPARRKKHELHSDIVGALKLRKDWRFFFAVMFAVMIDPAFAQDQVIALNSWLYEIWTIVQPVVVLMVSIKSSGDHGAGRR